MIDTPRLRIRPVRMSDAPAIQTHISQWDVAKYLTHRIPWPYPADGAVTFLRNVALPGWKRKQLYTFAITSRNRRDFIGVISITTDETCRDQRGFWFAKEHWGKGYATEAAEAVTDWAFLELGLPRIVTSNALVNAASHQIKAHGPWELVGVKDDNYVSGTHPTAIWSVTREAWLAWRGGKASPVVASMLAVLEDSADPKRAAHGAGYFPTSMRILGVSVPALRAAVQPAIQILRTQSPQAARVIASELHSCGVFEARQAAYEILGALPKARRGMSQAEVEALAIGNDNWCSVDTYATWIAGPAWREGVITDATISAWSASPDRWLRRTALACTVALNMKARGGKGDVARTLWVCERHVADKDDMVVKALSWALRSAIEHDEAAVRGFLTRHDGVLAGRVKREVGNKLTTGLKNP